MLIASRRHKFFGLSAKIQFPVDGPRSKSGADFCILDLVTRVRVYSHFHPRTSLELGGFGNLVFLCFGTLMG